MTAGKILDICKSAFVELISASRNVIDWLITPIDPSGIPIIGWLLPDEWLPYTPLMLIMGTGLVIYLTWSLVKWLIP